MSTQVPALSKKQLIGLACAALFMLTLFSCVTHPQTQGIGRDYVFDLSQWKITLPDGSERNTQWLQSDGTVVEQ